MKNYGVVNGVNFWLPSDEEIGGNIYFRYPNSAQIREAIHKKLGIVDAMEPDYYTGGTVLRVEDIHIANMINYKLKTCVKCNGIVTTKSFMERTDMGVFGRSSDCLMAAIITDTEVWMLHISCEALNNGIMLNIPNLFGKNAKAVLGPCISQKNYGLTEEVAKERLSNFETLGYYNLFCSKQDSITYVDIKGIATIELLKRGIEIAYDDNRCTYDNNLGSHRLKNGRANPIYLWLS